MFKLLFQHILLLSWNTDILEKQVILHWVTVLIKTAWQYHGLIDILQTQLQPNPTPKNEAERNDDRYNKIIEFFYQYRLGQLPPKYLLYGNTGFTGLLYFCTFIKCISFTGIYKTNIHQWFLQWIFNEFSLRSLCHHIVI